MPSPTTGTQLNEINDLTNGSDIELLKKQLPHVDLETGLKNRVVKRDPITGLGDLPKEHIDLTGRIRTSSVGRSAFNATLIAWDADTAMIENAKIKPSKSQGPKRNPIALTGDLGEEVDSIRATRGPRAKTPREPHRDPISGRGDFGDREWDPIGKYNGQLRRAKSSTGLPTNPLTGENLKSFIVMVEEKRNTSEHANRRNCSSKNIFTGENCAYYVISPESKATIKKTPRDPHRNAITGENCSSYDYNSEVRTSKKRGLNKSNPLNGENVSAFFVSQEERPRPLKPYVYKNTVTGENVSSYKITPIERNITPRELKARTNPLSGENVSSYTYRPGESKRIVKRRDLSSPITGDGSRGLSYTVSIEEKHLSQPNLAVNKHEQNQQRATIKSTRNVLTGENCITYSVNQEMRSEKVGPKLTKNGDLPKYNIITGEAN